MWTCFLLVTLSIVFGITDAGYCISSYNCTEQCSYSAKYYKTCGIFFASSACAAYRTEYRSCAHTCYKQDCCQGYTGSYCQIPTCFGSTSCPNGGRCISPDKCECLTGFAAPNCTDVNECALYNGGCSTNCENTMGSYYCTCKSGYYLHDDGISCIIHSWIYGSSITIACCIIGAIVACVIKKRICCLEQNSVGSSKVNVPKSLQCSIIVTSRQIGMVPPNCN